MPADGGRRGRRDNGLDAAAYVPLLDVDPRVGEHLLDVLGSAGVPAYLEPSADIEPYTRAYALPSPPTDRLYVDRERRTEARRIVDAENPDGPGRRDRDHEPSHGLTDVDEERAWQQIVAAFDAPAAPNRPLRRSAPAEPGTADEPPAGSPDPGGTAGPAAAGPGAGPAGAAGPDVRGPAGGSRPGGRHRREDDDEAGWADLPAWPADPEDDRPRLPGRAAAPTGEDLDAAAAARQAAEERAAEEAADADDLQLDGPPELDEGHFEPPPPPPVPRPTRRTVAGLLLVALALLLFIAPGVVGLDDTTGFTLGILSVLGGGVVLVLGLRDTRDDDGPDDGAVV